MLSTADFTLHGLTLRQLATADQLADILDMQPDAVGAHLDEAVAGGRAVAARGAYMITPTGRSHLDSRYPGDFAELRANDALAATLADFEQGINKQILSLMTAWQTVSVDGAEQPNDHSDAEYDAKIIDRLARLHERAATLLTPFADADPLIKRFLIRLDAALQRVDQGEHDYVSSVRIDSYHTVWYQMHEHLLRTMGQERDE
ncbi:hypothetical protein C5E51_02820 [Nocardia nova]|uniref:hypothetical protein n=1 Tax=Nocardia nova TaxID=37330 RepID=UPI000CE9EB36|nr:hypothetical protein [Nocardia nova]PPJ14428.1 hypothetical protein C5E51_02820 [Nocardia nova]